ncbi:MAG: hypothetical protein IJ055_01085, partial [Oscillospiraceae bacterium]|nr:hypothetical protein [Oscillospiraceae bacterium]
TAYAGDTAAPPEILPTPVQPEPVPQETPDEPTEAEVPVTPPETVPAPAPDEAPTVQETAAARETAPPAEAEPVQEETAAVTLPAAPAETQPPAPVRTAQDYTVRMERYYDPQALAQAYAGEPSPFTPDPEAPWYENDLAAADEVVQGEVISVGITRIGYRLWQQVDIRITGSRKGSLIEGDTVSVYELGGSLPLADYLSRNPDAVPILVPGMEGMEQAVYREESGCVSASQVGDTCLYLLRRGDAQVPDGAYLYVQDADHSRLWQDGADYVCAGDPDSTVPAAALKVQDEEEEESI